MPVDYASLTPGSQLASDKLSLDDETVARYVDAVGDETPLASDDDPPLAPAMAVAALSFRGVIRALDLPSGSLHLAQELEFARPVAVGETLECRAQVLQNSVRRGMRVLVVSLEATDAQGLATLSGKSTVMLPVQRPGE